MTLMEIAQLLGNFGEFVGAIAVVVTLAYLAVQVKHGQESLNENTKVVRGQVVSQVTQNAISYLHMFTQGQDTAGAFLRAAADEPLDSNDQFQNDAVLSAMFIARQHEFFQWQQGLLDEKVFESLHHITLLSL